MAPIAASLPLLLAWPAAAQVLHATFPSAMRWGIALTAAAATVGWRAFGTREERRKDAASGARSSADQEDVTPGS
jgi:hypothetical protein